MTQDVEMKELPAPSNSVTSTSPSTLQRKGKELILCGTLTSLKIFSDFGCVGVFRFEGDSIAHREQRVCSRGSPHCACYSAYHDIKEEAEGVCALWIPKLCTNPGIGGARPVVVVSSQGNYIL